MYEIKKSIMKKSFVLISFFTLVLTVEAKRKADSVLLDEEFNPWFQYEETVPKVSMYRRHSTTPLASKMDVIHPDSAKYTPSKEVFGTTRPNHIPIPTKGAIKRFLTIAPKIEHMSTPVDLKRVNNSN